MALLVSLIFMACGLFAKGSTEEITMMWKLGCYMVAGLFAIADAIYERK